MALTPEQELEVQKHLQESQHKPGIMDAIRQYAMNHGGLGAGDQRDAQTADNVDPQAPQPVQRFAKGGTVLPDAPSLEAPTFSPSSFDVNTQGPSLDDTFKMAGTVPNAPAPVQDMTPKPMPVAPPAEVPVQAPAQRPSNTAVDDEDDDTKKKNAKVISSHPGFNQDELEKYLMNEKAQVDKYGPDAMAANMKNAHDEQNGVVSSIGRRMAGASDAIMQGVARAGNGGALHAYDARQAQNAEQNMKQNAMLNDANMASIKAKEGLDTQSSHNALGASVASAMLPMLKQIYPGKTDAEYDQMARNPAVAEALLPEGVKLKDAAARLTQAKSDKEFQHQMARENLDYRKTHDYMTREQKDTSGMLKDPNVVKAQGTLDKLGTAKGLLESGNVNNATAKQALQTALTFVATGGQRVNETEMKQLGGAHTVSNRVNQWIQGLDRGTLTPKDYHDMKQVIGIYESSANQSLNDAMDRFGQVRSVREGISPEQAKKELGQRAPAAAPTQTPPPEITSQEAYNALPSGASYTSNGVPHRKK